MGLVDFDLGDIGEVLVKAREAFTGKRVLDEAEMKEIAFKFQKLENAIGQGQVEINKIEASHDSIFVAGWRPFIGWVGGVGLAYAFVISPLIEWIVKFNGLDIVPPTIEWTVLLNLVLAMLGFGGLRTYEKLKNVSRESLIEKK